MEKCLLLYVLCTTMFESFGTLPAFASASKTQQASAKQMSAKPSNKFIVEISYTLDVYFFEQNIFYHNP